LCELDSHRRTACVSEAEIGFTLVSIMTLALFGATLGYGFAAAFS